VVPDETTDAEATSAAPDWQHAHRALLDDILREARDRRASGDLPADLERELDATFDALVPHPGIDDPGALIARAEAAARIDPAVPAASGIPGGAAAKRTVKRAMFWYVNFVTDQVREFADASNRVLRMLDHRVALLEERIATPDARALARLGPLPGGADPAPWAEAILGALAGVDGRVLHGECGHGDLVARLAAAGIDAYGVEPRADAADAAALAGLEVRTEDVLAHLDTVTDRGLGGAVLSGVSDVVALPAKLRVVEAAARVLRPGGRLVLVATRPERWGTGQTAVLADLAPEGRPLHEATWRQLLAVHGFADVATNDDRDRDTFLVVAVRGPA
jgi:SAM-dependent methyltransferase